MSESGRVRAFLAVPPDPDWADSASRLIAGIRPAMPDASWTRPETWHVTLRFLGNVSREELAAFAESVGRAVSGIPSAGLRSGESVVFPPRGPARVLGVGFRSAEGGDRLAEAASAAERCARAIGLEPERRRFHPHVTLARLRRPWPPSAVESFRGEVGAWKFPTWPLGRFVLYESRLEAGGAVHTPAAEWTLRAAERTA
jgi:RNA 2',3'-cyclic 3'-phosphodiesterase